VFVLSAFAIMVHVRILVTNDDGWDAPGLAALKAVAAQLGQVFVLAPKDPHSYAGHRVTIDSPLVLAETGTRQFTLTGTPADCVRLAVSTLFPDIDWVLAGINRGGNLGADIFTSGTVAAVREGALLGRPGIAVSQFIRKGVALDWTRSGELALPVDRAADRGGLPAQRILERESAAPRYSRRCRRRPRRDPMRSGQ
jgi:5'-nucleotidase